MTSVIQNLRYLIETVASYDCARGAAMPGLHLLDSGTGSESDNFALLMPDEIGGLDEVERAAAGAKKFFGDAPRNWPLFPGLPDGTDELLSRHGAVRDEIFFDMSISLEDSALGLSEGPAAEICAPETSDEWADAMWQGFDSGEPAPASVIELACAMAADDRVDLYGARVDGALAATSMMIVSGGCAGVYYVATRPQARRSGLATALMHRMAYDARRHRASALVLLATPAGRPFYERLGMTVSGEVPIFIER